MKSTLFIFALFLTYGFSAQTANMVLLSDEGTSFKLTINNIVQDDQYHDKIQVNKMQGERPYNMKIEFKDDTVILQKNIYLIDEGVTHIYRVNKEQVALKKIVPAATYNPGNIQQINFTENKNMPVDTMIPVKDTLTQEDTVYVPPYESYYKLEDYDGKIGCPFPIKTEKLVELRGIILNETLEESKLEKVKTAIQGMDSVCIMIDQVKELIVLFEYEETRLDFAKFISSYLFDIDNVGKLSEVFNFENSMEELKKHLGI